MHRLLIPVLAFLLWLPAALAAPAPEGVLLVERAQVLISDAYRLPASNREWQEVDLPHRTHKPEHPDLVTYWYRAQFNYDAQSKDVVWLYFPRLRSGGTIYINGIPIHSRRGADAAYQVRWFRPQLLTVPASMLKSEGNELAVRLTIREPLTSFGEFMVGPEEPLRQMYREQLFWETTTRDLASMLCVAVGVFSLVFWLRRRQEELYKAFAVCAVLWGARTVIIFMPVVPMMYWEAWRILYYMATGGFIVGITVFILKFSNFRNATLNRFLNLYLIAGVAAFALFGTSVRALLDIYWLAGFLPFVLFAFARLATFAWRQKTIASGAMVATILLSIGLSLHDFAVQNGWFGLREIYLLHLGIPAFLVAMLWAMMDRFIVSLEQAEFVNERLALLVDKREEELAANYRQITQLERRHAAAEERQRIIQDMHDGVGSRLVSALALVQCGEVSQQELAGLLQESLDEMRLVIDSMAPEEPDLLPALWNFRHRMEPRLKRIGIELIWRTENLPEKLDLAPHTGLHVLRILQETIANVLKHAQATKVTVLMRYAAGHFEIRVEDDGIGLDASTATRGHGMTSMRNRAKKIGAAFRVDHTGRGCGISLAVPLAEASSA